MSNLETFGLSAVVFLVMTRSWRIVAWVKELRRPTHLGEFFGNIH